MQQVYNPYLPLDTYIPDGEPHVFGDRLYVFGSHDAENGTEFCVLDYECFSAPIDDLSDWRSEGIIYRAEQDPGRNKKDKYMYAPDVVQGCDGRYYLYYAMSGGHFTGAIHVAVCDTPAGIYEYYGEVRNPDGSTFDRCITFDPGLLNDNGKIYLYYGWAIGTGTQKVPKFMTKFSSFICKHFVGPKLFEKTKEQIKREPYGIEGGNVVELEADMLTVKGEPKRLAPGQFDAIGTEWEGHAFFEASSMRKIGDTYYYIFSSQVNHELCYATSKYPDRDFHFGGVLISNGDVGYQGRKLEERLAITGNNHGSMVCVTGQWYMFYHRHTNKTCYSRQGCAEKIEILPDGSIPQVEMTSQGLNDGPLVAKGSYPATICCNLFNAKTRKKGHTPIVGNSKRMPYVTCREGERFVAELCDGAVVGYKYFSFEGETILYITYRGYGKLSVYADDEKLGELLLGQSDTWARTLLTFEKQGVHALYLKTNGDTMCDLLEIAFVDTPTS
ncbi:MAG: family 43 glycosylhydrolase [Butyrivibrio sp.]|nr:family 43 glycosylhydrolase [Butyrivibrio sp.]